MPSQNPQKDPQKEPLKKKIAFTLVLLGLLWGAVELVCLGGLWALERYKNLQYSPELVRVLSAKHRGLLAAYLAGKEGYLGYEPTLGWTVRPGGATKLYRATAQGLRGDREYTPDPPAGKVRLAAFGDSFTHASDVPNEATWEVQLERIEPRLEVLNFGVPGYGPDQALLRYEKDGLRFKPQVVVLGFMSDDVNRAVNVYRPFFFYQSGLPLAKPRFELHGGRLVEIPNPLPRLADYRRLLDDPQRELPLLGRHDYFFLHRHQRSRFDFLPSVRIAHVVAERFEQPVWKDGIINRDSEAGQVSLAIFDEFRRRALGRGSFPLIVFFPDRRDIRAVREGRPRLYAPLLADLRHRGVPVVDLLDGFELWAHDIPRKQLAKVHYTPRGYRIAARTLLAELRRRGLTTPEGVRAAVAAERQARR